MILTPSFEISSRISSKTSGGANMKSSYFFFRPRKSCHNFSRSLCLVEVRQIAFRSCRNFFSLPAFIGFLVPLSLLRKEDDDPLVGDDDAFLVKASLF